MLCQQDLSLFWVAMALVVVTPCGVAWWLYRTFSDTGEEVCPMHGVPYRTQWGSEGEEITHICDRCIEEENYE